MLVVGVTGHPAPERVDGRLAARSHPVVEASIIGEINAPLLRGAFRLDPEARFSPGGVVAVLGDNAVDGARDQAIGIRVIGVRTFICTT